MEVPKCLLRKKSKEDEQTEVRLIAVREQNVCHIRMRG